MLGQVWQAAAFVRDGGSAHLGLRMTLGLQKKDHSLYVCGRPWDFRACGVY